MEEFWFSEPGRSSSASLQPIPIHFLVYSPTSFTPHTAKPARERKRERKRRGHRKKT